MKNQIAQINQIQIQGTNLPKLIEKSLFESLPPMLKMEISQEIIAESEPDVKLNLADDVMRLLNVRERNSEMAKDWLLFISSSNFKVTAGEIYLAFKMAISREILDSNEKEIDLYPELSNNTTGKVISAYIRHKKNNLQYQLSKDKLKALKSPVNELTENEKLELHNNLLKLIFEDIKVSGFSCDAWHIYPNLELSGKIKPSAEEKTKLYKEQLRIYEIEEKALIRNKYSITMSKPYLNNLTDKITGKKPVESVSNKCRSILVSKYMKQFIADFETFKKQLENYEPNNPKK